MILTTTMKPGVMKSAALDLAGRGLKVFPVTARGKEPLKGSAGHLEATDDPALIERLWRDNTYANIGVAAAVSGLYMIDVDMNPWKKKVGDVTWAALVAEHGHVETYTVRSWSGGLHYWYRMPEGMNLRNTTGTGGSTGRGLGKDIDTRGNGYVIAPPSVVYDDGHSGVYSVEKDLPIADLPEWIIDMVRDVERPALAGPVDGPLAPDDMVLARVQKLANELRDAPDGEGNHTASRLAFWVGQYVGAEQIDETEAVGMLLDAVAGWTWRSTADVNSMTKTIIKGVQEGAKQPRPWEKPIASPSAALSAPLAAQAVSAAVPVTEPAPEAPADPEKEAERDLSDWATDLGQAYHLQDRLRPRLMHADGVGWHCWDGTRWAPVSKDHVMNMATRFYRSQFRSMLDKYKDTEEDRYLLLAKAYKSFMGGARLTSIVKVMAVIDGVYADPATLDRHLDLLNTPACVVNLRTGEKMKHDPALLMTKVTSGGYRPGFRHKDWDKALEALSPEQAAYMQVRMGQAATGHNSKDVIFLVGTGNNGKSAYSTEGVFPALGSYAHMAQPTLISKGQGTGATPDRASLRGCRFVLIEELPESHALSVEEIKRITDTGVITARMLHSNPITFNATHALFVTSNSRPSVSEVDHGTWRRLLLVDFPLTFCEKPEGPNERKGDPTLKRRVNEGNDGQHDAIVTWLVEGAMKYFADPMLMEIERRPLEVRESIRAWQMEADRILAYFTERLLPDPETMITRADLYWDFTQFLMAQGHAKWSQETFLSRLRTHEVYRRAGIEEAQRRSAEGLSRPPGVLGRFGGDVPKLSERNRVLVGLKFRTDV
jgi:P4 family phage/plasmid primase-like protien